MLAVLELLVKLVLVLLGQMDQILHLVRLQPLQLVAVAVEVKEVFHQLMV